MSTTTQKDAEAVQIERYQDLKRRAEAVSRKKIDIEKIRFATQQALDEARSEILEELGTDDIEQLKILYREKHAQNKTKLDLMETQIAEADKIYSHILQSQGEVA